MSNLMELSDVHLLIPNMLLEQESCHQCLSAAFVVRADDAPVGMDEHILSFSWHSLFCSSTYFLCYQGALDNFRLQINYDLYYRVFTHLFLWFSILGFAY